MSDQEKKIRATSGSSLVIVEQSTGNKHKPYRPTEIPDEPLPIVPILYHKPYCPTEIPDEPVPIVPILHRKPYGPTEIPDEPLPILHHKRSRGLVAPALVEELKDSAINTEQKKINLKETAPVGISVVVVEDPSASINKPPYRPTEIPDELLPDLDPRLSRAPTVVPDEQQPDQHPKRLRAPSVPSVLEETKDSSIIADKTDIKERTENERVYSEKQKHLAATKLSSTTTTSRSIKRQETTPETLTLTPVELVTKRVNAMKQPSKPIPAHVSATSSATISDITKKKDVKKKDDEDSITEEIGESRTADQIQKSVEWSDEEASGLPRSESRASLTSRVSRAMRQLVCCGVRLEATSEEDVFTLRNPHAI